MNLLNQIIKEMLETHKGGEQFFNNLDLAVQKQPIINKLYCLIEKDKKFVHNIIVSGKFGRFFSNYYSKVICNLICVNGGLRKGNPIDSLDYLKDQINNQEFIFVDDSFYKGRTRDMIKNEIERLGDKLIKTYVIYDGSKIKDNNVVSLYRYYDNFKIGKIGDKYE